MNRNGYRAAVDEVHVYWLKRIGVWAVVALSIAMAGLGVAADLGGWFIR